MRRVVCLCGLLLPLMLRGADLPVSKAPAPPAVVPAAKAKAPAPVDFQAYPDTSKLMDRTVAALTEALAQPATPARQSLLKVDLNRHLRFAVLSRPKWDRTVLGRSSLDVPVFSLRW